MPCMKTRHFQIKNKYIKILGRGHSTSVAGETETRLLSWITPTRASNRCRLKSFTSCAFCSGLTAPDFVMKCIEARAVRWPEVWKSTGLLHYCTFGLEAANDAQNVRVDTARWKDNDQQSLSKMIMWYCRVYNQIASNVWRYNIILFISSWWTNCNRC